MVKKLKILYAEDNPVTARENAEALEENGYEVQTVYSGEEAWQAFQESTPDIVLLDYLMPPGKTGLEVFQLIRQIDAKVPVLILSSYGDTCSGLLKNGVTDFIAKDHGFEEACARIEVAWKRRNDIQPQKPETDRLYRLSEITTYQTGSQTLIMCGQRIPLNSIVGEVLTILCQNLNMYVTRQALCKRIWNLSYENKSKLLGDYISKLRKILKDDPALQISAGYGTGYCLQTSVQLPKDEAILR